MRFLSRLRSVRLCLHPAAIWIIYLPAYVSEFDDGAPLVGIRTFSGKMETGMLYSSSAAALFSRARECVASAKARSVRKRTQAKIAATARSFSNSSFSQEASKMMPRREKRCAFLLGVALTTRRLIRARSSGTFRKRTTRSQPSGVARTRFRIILFLPFLSSRKLRKSMCWNCETRFYSFESKVDESRVTRKCLEETRWKETYERKRTTSKHLSVVARDYSHPDPLKRKSVRRVGRFNCSKCSFPRFKPRWKAVSKIAFHNREAQMAQASQRLRPSSLSPYIEAIFHRSITDRPSEESSRREGARELPLAPFPFSGSALWDSKDPWSLSRKIKDIAAHSPKWMFLAGFRFANPVCGTGIRAVSTFGSDFRELLAIRSLD